jgi:hypothetical protein
VWPIRVRIPASPFFKKKHVYVNKITHSYTAQYAITALGKLLPMVFICLQERSGTFGPRISEEARTLSQKFGNVFVTATKSGKL